jgi:hypothetical protein
MASLISLRTVQILPLQILPLKLLLLLGACIGFLGIQNTVWACRMMVILQQQPCQKTDTACSQRLNNYIFEDTRALKHQGHAEEPYYQLGGISTPVNTIPGVVPNIDGAGMVGYTQVSSQKAAMKVKGYLRQSIPLQQEDTAFKNALAQWLPETSVFLLHSRAATVGQAVAENNHPYQIVLSERAGDTWSFMGNGGSPMTMAYYTKHIHDPRIQSASAANTKFAHTLHQSSPPQSHPSLAPEMTDTERLFHLMLQEALPTLKGQPLSEAQLQAFKGSIRRTYERTMSQYPTRILKPFAQGKGYMEGKGPEGFMTPESLYPRHVPNSVVLSNGEYTFLLLHEYPLFYQLHKSPATASHPEQVTTMVIASEPTNLASFYLAGERFPEGITRWQWFPDHTLVMIHRDAQGHLTMHWEPLILKIKPPAKR